MIFHAAHEILPADSPRRIKSPEPVFGKALQAWCFKRDHRWPEYEAAAVEVSQNPGKAQRDAGPVQGG